ncbi:hypothetical protein [Burkholderia ubonensis]|uniref:hypothetical protein n=1 Tax=Burkholderia ubonensis TaxID=101571 RepID=UPI00075CBB96|nr:hypothetical protein [Burkholderia ubonensis]KVL67378.1 hypothetical protein WJ48_14085 [Burkholderia ubonensis]KVL71431.1 hypothetical protein WJ49_20410 [Burkholderia ubonensis]KVL91320.1 hypothetical protein WJ50_11395 [Burkholderia ubonensis]KWK75570.1 hypothetical protein WM15_30460 [Burkholderia ubonensis]
MTEEVLVDKQYQIHRHAAVTEQQPFVTAMKAAAERAYADAMKQGRKPAMVEIIVYVAPEQGA